MLSSICLQDMLALDPESFPDLYPNVATFNTFLHRAAKRQDKVDAKKILALMRKRGMEPDAYTFAAIGTLRTFPAPTSSFIADDSGAAVAEAEVDTWLAQLLKSNDVFQNGSMRASAGVLNQVCENVLFVATLL